ARRDPLAGQRLPAQARSRSPASGATPSAASRSKTRFCCGARVRGTVSLAEEAGIRLERLVSRLIRLLHPPGGERVVAVLKAEPAAPRAPQALDGRQRAVGGRPLRTRLAPRLALQLAARLGDLLGQPGQVPSDLRPVPGLERPTRLVQFEDRPSKGDQRVRIGPLLGAEIALPQLVGQVVLEEEVIDLAVLSEPVEIERADPVEPSLCEVADPLVAAWRERRRCGPHQAAPVGVEALDGPAELTAVE